MKRPRCFDVHTFNQLRMLASNAAMRFAAPVYLVGSCLTSKNPLDIDLLLVVTERQFKGLIGDSKKIFNSYIKQRPGREYLRQARLIAKQKHYFDRHLYGFDTDFKIVTWEDFKRGEGEKLRLDCFESLF